MAVWLCGCVGKQNTFDVHMSMVGLVEVVEVVSVVLAVFEVAAGGLVVAALFDALFDALLEP